MSISILNACQSATALALMHSLPSFIPPLFILYCEMQSNKRLHNALGTLFFLLHLIVFSLVRFYTHTLCHCVSFHFVSFRSHCVHLIFSFLCVHCIFFLAVRVVNNRKICAHWTYSSVRRMRRYREIARKKKYKVMHSVSALCVYTLCFLLWEWVDDTRQLV